MEQKVVDAKGMACPMPVISAKNASETFTQDGELKVLVDNQIAVQNLLKFAKQRGYDAESAQLSEKEYQVVMQVTPGAGNEAQTGAEETPEEICECCGKIRKGQAVVLSADVMGAGDDKLGKALMKSFVFALTKQDLLPETIVCYNGGAFLTCEGAETLEDLKDMAEAGVNIVTCGTCLDFYGLKEKLAVGSVSNMYEIVEILENASRVVRP